MESELISAGGVLDIQRLIDICRDSGTERVALFGSWAMGTAGSDSDVDILVKFSQPTSLLALVNLERKLSDAIGKNVDLYTSDALSPYMKQGVLLQQKILYDSAA